MSTATRLHAPLLAATLSASLAPSATAQVTTAWTASVNSVWHQFGNWSQLLPPNQTQQISLNPNDGPDPAIINVFRDDGIAVGLGLEMTDGDCFPVPCDHDTLLIGVPGAAGRARLELAEDLIVIADSDNIFGSGEANLALSDLDLVTKRIRVIRDGDATASLRLTNQTTWLREYGGVHVAATGGTSLILDNAHIRALDGESPFEVDIAVGAALVTGASGGESTIRGTLHLNGQWTAGGITRVDRLYGSGFVSVLGEVVVSDPPNGSAFEGSTVGPGRLIKDGDGMLTLREGSKLHLGGIEIRGGRLIPAGNDQLGLGDITLAGGTLSNFTPFEGLVRIDENPIRLEGPGGTIEPWYPLTITTEISGPGMLHTTGRLLSLGAAATYAGGTTVRGPLAVVNPFGSATGSGPVTVAEYGRLMGFGTIAGPITVESGGTVLPGDIEPSTLRGGDAVFESGSTLRVRLDTGQNDRLLAAGTVQIEPGAVLEVVLEPGFVPDAGARFVVLEAAEITGGFEWVQLPAGVWCVEQTGDAVELVFAGCDPEPCAGDVDADGVVDFDDLLSVIAAFGDVCEGCGADLDGDGSIDFDDLLAVLGAFGACP